MVMVLSDDVISSFYETICDDIIYLGLYIIYKYIIV